jgi:hypothetical protein
MISCPPQSFEHGGDQKGVRRKRIKRCYRRSEGERKEEGTRAGLFSI